MNRMMKVAMNSMARRYFCSSTDSKPAEIFGTLPKDGNGIAVSQYAETFRTFTREQVSQFASLVGDSNPLHTCWHKEDFRMLHSILMQG